MKKLLYFLVFTCSLCSLSAQYNITSSMSPGVNDDIQHLGGDIIAKGPVHDARIWGAVPDGRFVSGTSGPVIGTDNYQAIQNAINKGGITFLPRDSINDTTGTIYVIDSTLVIGNRQSLYIPANVTLVYTGQDSAAIEIGINGTLLGEGKIMSDRTRSQLDTNNIRYGILVSGNTGVVDFGFIENYEYGVYLLGDGRGCAYNNVKIRSILSCLHAVELDAYNEGWVNQNYIHVDRITNYSNPPSLIENKSYGIYMDSHTINEPNANRFSGSVEQVRTGMRLVGYYNRLDGLRFELPSSWDTTITIELDYPSGDVSTTKTNFNYWFGEYGTINWSKDIVRLNTTISRRALQPFGVKGFEQYIDEGIRTYQFADIWFQNDTLKLGDNSSYTINWSPNSSNSSQRLDVRFGKHTTNMTIGQRSSHPWNEPVIGIGADPVQEATLLLQGADQSSGLFGLRVADSSGTVNLAVRNDGNIGIGTTAPQEPLHVTGIIRSDSLVPGGNVVADTNGNLKLGNITSYDWFKSKTTNSPISINDSIYTYGAVGIGTDDPDEDLTILRNGATLKLQASQSPSDYKVSLTANYNYNNPFTLSAYGGTVMKQDTGSNLSFYAGSVERMRIDKDNGYVGIGTIPTEHLHVKGSDATTLKVQAGTTVNSWSSRVLLDRLDDYRAGGVWVTSSSGSENDWYMGVPYTGSGFTIGTHSTLPHYKVNSSIFVATNGNVGIKTTTPDTFALDVNGSGRITYMWTQSDSRFKRNISSIEGTYDKIKLLNGVSYSFRRSEFEEKNFPDGSTYGFIAQELKEVFPELVMQGKDGYFAINYTGLIPVLMEALKEQQEKIELLEGEIGEMKEMIENICSSGCGGTLDQSGKIVNNKGSEASDKNTFDGIILFQNRPNPYNESTIIGYRIPDDFIFNDAFIAVYRVNGIQLKKWDINEPGEGNIEILGQEFVAGIYLYSLFVNGKEIDTKRMVLVD